MTGHQGIFKELADRFGDDVLAERLRLQVDYAATMSGKGRGKLHFENLGKLTTACRIGLALTGLTKRCERESLNFQIERIETTLPTLPVEFDGLRILQLSDIHIDGFVDGGTKLQESLRHLEFDLCVLTGDYRFLTYGPYEKCGEKMTALLKKIHCEMGTYAILGNHDFIEEIPYFEAAGVPVLLNESVHFSRGKHALYLAGVDDPHFYGLDDIKQALTNVPRESCIILLAHSPEIYKEASGHAVDFYLCGHTHGGQICLPGGTPIITHGACPRSMCRGPWSYREMQGYTARGTGCSGVQARLNCPPEITIHTLRNA
ncbi:metallophosphoesterase [Pseudodesulfovibrio sp. JC047]|uniref:metallophosphoesterase n=1 Tax=Pseudodesulfovibrio sp. JC047 TaxID=2683199 RepID=UPI0013D55DBA|nr:metallophosphoesterase [Pseudodesulfovibrio sp. JC047]NDV19271.1 metallophosphoesterase [Pseudodesulfovibrio sp. JC047]